MSPNKQELDTGASWVTDKLGKAKWAQPYGAGQEVDGAFPLGGVGAHLVGWAWRVSEQGRMGARGRGVYPNKSGFHSFPLFSIQALHALSSRNSLLAVGEGVKIALAPP